MVVATDVMLADHLAEQTDSRKELKMAENLADGRVVMLVKMLVVRRAEW